MTEPTSQPILAVDLDGTLLRSDMFVESFWAMLAQRPLQLIALLPGRLAAGRAALKAALAERCEIDVATLPYNPDVIAYIEAARAAGQRTMLVTASNEAYAQRIADHLGLFDEVHGSSASENLKGATKAALLARICGAQGYDYMGDSRADLAVWKGARKAISVDAGSGLRRRIAALGVASAHLGAEAPLWKDHLRAMRPHQWLKNVLIFVPMLAGHALGTLTIVQSVLAFLSFSLVASSVYVLNDLLDLAADRAHPRKRNRPFASGVIPSINGLWMAPGLFLWGGLLAAGLGLKFLGVMMLYFIATTAYSFVLKRKLVIDIVMLSALYTLRIIAGGAATGVSLSVWLLGFAMFLFFALAAVKRQAELVDGIARGKLTASGRGYNVNDLPVVTSMAIASGFISVLVMTLYVTSPDVLALYSRPAILWGISPVLLYWISRMVMITHRGEMDDDPVVFAARDRLSQGVVLLIAGLVLAAARF